MLKKKCVKECQYGLYTKTVRFVHSIKTNPELTKGAL